jgi:hypothetical protein
MKTIVWICVLLLLFGIVGRIDYEVAKADAEERRSRLACPPRPCLDEPRRPSRYAARSIMVAQRPAPRHACSPHRSPPLVS